MKSIELTEEHKSKLLEMCNTLFPDTKWHFWQSEIDNYPDGMLGYNQHAILGKHKTIQPSLEIHWFEFCMTHLCNKIWEKYPKYSKNHIYNGLAITEDNGVKAKSDLILRTLKNNPVDYLYSEFLKLSK